MQVWCTVPSDLPGNKREESGSLAPMGLHSIRWNKSCPSKEETRRCTWHSAKKEAIRRWPLRMGRLTGCGVGAGRCSGVTSAIYQMREMGRLGKSLALSLAHRGKASQTSQLSGLTAVHGSCAFLLSRMCANPQGRKSSIP